MKITKPHIVFFGLALIVFLLGFFSISSENYVDINIHDTYYVIASFHFATFISLVLTFIGFIYFLHTKFDIPLFKILTITHIIVTSTGLVSYYFSEFYYEPSSTPLFSQSISFSDFLAFLIIISIFCQPLILINSVFSLIKYYSKPKL